MGMEWEQGQKGMGVTLEQLSRWRKTAMKQLAINNFTKPSLREDAMIKQRIMGNVAKSIKETEERHKEAESTRTTMAMIAAKCSGSGSGRGSPRPRQRRLMERLLRYENHYSSGAE